MAQIGSIGGLGLTADTTHIVAGLLRARDSLERFKKTVTWAQWTGYQRVGVDYGHDFLNDKPEPPALSFTQRRKLRLLAPWRLK